jgi:Fic family protein
MHEALLERSAPDIAGRWRDQQVWIGGGDLGPHGAAFVPPHHSRVRAAIADLVAFVDRDDVPVLAHAALAHAQFETIHPFPDGNGRTGRALVHSLLRTGGVTRHVTVPVSAGLLVDVDRYFDALTAYRSGDPFPIVERMAEAAYAAVHSGRALVAELRVIKDGWSGSLTARRQAVVWRALDVVIRQPVLDSALLQRELQVTAQAADGAIARFVEIGALRQFTAGRRNRVYEAPDVLAALDAFAERSIRQPPGDG